MQRCLNSQSELVSVCTFVFVCLQFKTVLLFAIDSCIRAMTSRVRCRRWRHLTPSQPPIGSVASCSLPLSPPPSLSPSLSLPLSLPSLSISPSLSLPPLSLSPLSLFPRSLSLLYTHARTHARTHTHTRARHQMAPLSI